MNLARQMDGLFFDGHPLRILRVTLWRRHLLLESETQFERDLLIAADSRIKALWHLRPAKTRSANARS